MRNQVIEIHHGPDNFSYRVSDGGLVMLADGNVVYTPPTHFSGVDSLIYTLSDDHGGTASGTVTVTVGMRHLYLPIALQ